MSMISNDALAASPGVPTGPEIPPPSPQPVDPGMPPESIPTPVQEPPPLKETPAPMPPLEIPVVNDPPAIPSVPS